MIDKRQAPVALRGWKEIAQFLNVTVRTAQNWAVERGLPIRKLGSMIVLEPEDYEKWIQQTEALPHRTLPKNLDAERAILGSIFVDNEQYYRVAERVGPEAFYLEAHRIIFSTMRDLISRGKPVDLINLQEELVRSGNLESVGGISFLAGLLDGIPHLVNIEPYVEIVKQKSVFRQIIRTANRIMAESFDEAGAAEEVLDRAGQALFSLSEARSKTGFVSTTELELSTVKLLEKLYVERQMITGVPTGFHDLDRMTAGFQPGDLIVLASRPSMGKTALAVNIIQHVAIQRKSPVGVFSLEMSKEQLMMRLLCSEARVDSQKVRTGYLGKDDFRKLIDTLGRVQQSPLYIDDSPTVTLIDIRAKCRHLKAEKGLSLIIIDYLQLMSGYGRTESPREEMTSIARGLKTLAKELNVPVVVLSQLSQTLERSMGDHKPRLFDLRESGSIEQDADLVVFIYREEVYKPSKENCGLADLIIAKQRNGPTGVVKAAFLREYSRFEALKDLQ
jgi:replicative DNA helicase